MTLTTPRTPPASATTAWWRRPVVAVLVVLALYGLVAWSNAASVGYLSTDTGGKVATLEVMDRTGSFTLDLGYWAEDWDSDGSLHPLWFTSRVDDQWVNATTVPMLVVARPLYELGGYRLALAVPMLGAAAAALAARALARRVGADPDHAFWLVALASPITVYALDFWEHTWGVAGVLVGLVALLDAREGRGSGRLGLLAGLAFGAAASMRTEALVFGFAATVVTCGLFVHARRMMTALRVGAGVVLGLGAAMVATTLLEIAVLGEPLRAGRSAGAAGSGGSELALRVEEALLTGVSLSSAAAPGTYLLGIVLLGLLVAFARADDPARQRLLLGGVGVLYALRFVDGLGFVPGLVAATPVAAAAVALPPPDRRARHLLAMVLVAVPLVWAFQYTGGAGPQWAGRYLLPAGTALGVLGLAALADRARVVRHVFVGLAVAVTLFGVAWVHERTTSIETAVALLADRPEPVLVWEPAFVAREGGPAHLDERWLTAVDDEARAEAAAVVLAAGFDRFGLVELDVGEAPAIDGFEPVETTRLEYLDGVWFRVTTYRVDR